MGGVAADLDHVVAPARAALGRLEPGRSEVDAPGEPVERVDHEQLAVVALLDALEAEARIEGRDRVVLRNLSPAGDERLPPGAVDAEAADGVVDDAHPDAAPRRVCKYLPESRADRVRADPVHLEEHLVLRPRDGRKHRGERLRPVPQ